MLDTIRRKRHYLLITPTYDHALIVGGGGGGGGELISEHLCASKGV